MYHKPQPGTGMRLGCPGEQSLLIVIAKAAGPKQSLEGTARLLHSARNDSEESERVLPVGTPAVDNLISLPHIYISDFTFLVSQNICNQVCGLIRGEIAKIFRPQGERDGQEATEIR